MTNYNRLPHLVSVSRATSRGGRREGVGRPREFKDSVDRTVRFERAELEAAKRIAERRGVSFGEIVRRALRAYIGRRGR